MIANRKTLGQSGHDGQHFRSVHAHDFRRFGAGQRVRVAFGLIGGDGRFEVYDESLVRCDGALDRIVRGKQLVVGAQEAFARVCARHQIGMRGSVVDLVDLDLSAGIVGIGFVAGQSFEGLVGRRFVAGALIEKAQHLIEGTVFQHKLDDIFY